MKRLSVCIIISLCFLATGFSQSNFTYNVQVIGKRGSGLNGVNVWLKNKNSGLIIAKYTNNNGTVVFDVTPGYWSLNLKGLPDYDAIFLRENESGSRSVTIAYDKYFMQSLCYTNLSLQN